MGFFFIFSKPRHGLAVGRGTGCFKPLGYFDEDCTYQKSPGQSPDRPGALGNRSCLNT